ncbi:hypothetical protein [Paenibacillus lautus]
MNKTVAPKERKGPWVMEVQVKKAPLQRAKLTVGYVLLLMLTV